MENFIELFEEDYKNELNHLRAQWQLTAAQIALAKKLDPDKSEALDEYFVSMKQILRNQILSDCINEEDKEETERDLKYILGEEE